MNNHLTKQSTRNSILAIVTTVLCSGFFFSLQAQPVLNQVEAEKLRPGQVADLVLRGTGFGEIQKINAVQIGDFDIAILEQNLSSDTEIKLTIRVPKQIRTGVYRFTAGYAGLRLSGRLSSRINAEPEIEVLFRNAMITDGQPQPVTFDSTNVGTPVIASFQINNGGMATLLLSNLQLPAGFRLDGEFPDSIGPSDGALFYIELAAANPGNYSGTLQFQTNNSDENPFEFSIAGSVGPASGQPVATPPIRTGEVSAEEKLTQEKPGALTEPSKPGMVVIILLTAVGAAAVFGAAFMVNTLRARKRPRRKRRSKSTVNFEAKKDLGSSAMDQAEPAKPAFELRLKPVLDLGKTHIRHEGASLVKEEEVSRRRAIDN